MPRPTRDEEFSAFVRNKRTGLVRSACLLTAGDTGTEAAYVWRIIVNAHIDEVRRPGRRREHHRPANDPSKDPDVFLGKLVVMLQSRDATSPPTGASQPVNGRPGVFGVQGDTQILTFQIAGGRWVVIQAPTSLGWDGVELARFAGGVQVLIAAQPGRG